MKKLYVVPEAQIIRICQTGSLLVTSGDIYNGSAGAPDIMDILEMDQNSGLDDYFDLNDDVEVW